MMKNMLALRSSMLATGMQRQSLCIVDLSQRNFVAPKRKRVNKALREMRQTKILTE